MQKKIGLFIGLTIMSLTLAGCTSLLPDNTPDQQSSADRSDSAPVLMDHAQHGNTAMQHDTIKSEEEFLVNMIPHHQEAIDTAKIVLEKGADSELKTMAEAIVAAQSTEITQMRQRIDERYPDSSLTSNYANMMPAMDTLSGNEVDKAFLEGMIMHHLGAVQMASDVLRVNHKGETMKLAEDIIRTQSQEIEIMRNMLKKYQ